VSNDDRSELYAKLMRRWVWKIPLIIALVWFAVWWQEKQEAERGASNAPAKFSAQSAVRFAGHWRADIAYRSGAKHSEGFFFQVEGERIFGTASLMGAKRGIEEVQLVGDALLFKLRYEEAADGTTRTRWFGYEARRAGDEINLKVFEDPGGMPLEARLTQVKTTDGERR